MRASWMAAMAAGVMLAGSSGAETLEVALSAPTVIAGEGVARVLFRPPDLTGLEDPLIFSAHLEFQLPEPGEERHFDVQVNPISRAWSEGSTSWTTPWSVPGGDRDDGYFRSTAVSGRRGTLRLDVTGMVRAMLEGEIESHGFMLSVPYEAGRGFGTAELSRLGTLSAGKLVIEYREFRTARGARGRGARS